MKRIIALMVAMMMLFTLTSCGSASDSTTEIKTLEQDGAAGSPTATVAADFDPYARETFKIGVVFIGTGDEITRQQRYYSEYLAPRYNCEFVFSETCSTTDAVMTFIENCADMGCQAIICYYNYDCEQLTQKCGEYGMYFVQNTNRNESTESTFTGGYENFSGTFGADQTGTGALFSDFLRENLKADEDHGFLVCTGWAYLGNEQHVKISTAIFESIVEAYGLPLENDISTYVSSSSPMEVVNDKGIEIYAYPDIYTTDGWLQGFASCLQTGKYDYVLSSIPTYANCGVIIDEIEQSYDMDITQACLGQLGDALVAAFETQDIFGNSSLDMSTVKFNTLVASMPFIQVYNCLTGYQNCLQDEEGEMTGFTFVMCGATTVDQIHTMTTWDMDNDTWVANYDFVDSCLGVYNEGLTAADIQENINSMNYDTILASFDK